MQLLEHGDQKDMRDAAMALASRSFTIAEVACLQRVAGDRAAPMHAAAVSTLARLGHVEVLEAAVEFPSARNPGRRLLFEAFRDLPMEATRPYVREWLNGQDDYRRRAAAAALGRHATPADLASVRERLTTEIARGLGGEQYVICSLASALERHPSHGPFPELVAAYEAMPYSFGRHFVVDAMAATDPSFPTGIGVDCLWDAEASTRQPAAGRVDRDAPAAAARLLELRCDEDEDPGVRAAAA